MALFGDHFGRRVWVCHSEITVWEDHVIRIRGVRREQCFTDPDRSKNWFMSRNCLNHSRIYPSTQVQRETTAKQRSPSNQQDLCDLLCGNTHTQQRT